MRMWHKTLTKHLCNKHLVAAHGEIHKHHHNFVKQHSMLGRVSPVVQIEPARMGAYHDELVREMLKRGLNHFSPYAQPDIAYLPKEQRLAKIDLKENITALEGRCAQCKANLERWQSGRMRRS